MKKIKSIILPIVLSVIVLSMVISPTYPSLNAAHAVELPPVLSKKCDLSLPPDEPISPDCELLNLIIAEEASREAADIVLQNNIDQEVADRIADVDQEEADRIADVDQEEADRIADVDQEEADRIAADANLQTQINNAVDGANEAIDEAIIALGIASGLFAAGAAGCSVACPPTAVALGTLSGLMATTAGILAAISFSS